MIIKTINSITSFHRLIEKYPCHQYRGVSNHQYKLIPRVGRGWKLSVGLLKVIEKFVLNRFKKDAYRHINKLPSLEIEWLTIAQHYGSSTRLLDWTKNPLVALYFACRENSRFNSAVYFSLSPEYLDMKLYDNPFSVKGTKTLEPRISTERISNQQGIFTITENPTIEASDGVFLKAIIRASLKRIFIQSLNKYGINESSLFPGIEGAARESVKLLELFIPLEDEEKLMEVLEKVKKEQDTLFTES